MNQCSEDKCEKQARARGLCGTHYQRWYRTDRYGVPKKATGRPRSEWVSYAGAHERVKRDRGLAKNLQCELCGKPAQSWAYDGLDPDEKIGVANFKTGALAPYSLKPEHYHAACTDCHADFDKTLRNLKAE